MNTLLLCASFALSGLLTPKSLAKTATYTIVRAIEFHEGYFSPNAPNELRLAADPYANLSIEEIRQRYQTTRKNITRKRNALTQQYANARTDSARRLVRAKAAETFRKALTEEIIPFWYGTEWDYNGYTAKPREGVIACGYFVSTTVKHCGIEVNRYDLAKKYSHAIVKTLCDEERMITIRGNDTTALLTYIDLQPNDVYVVGLDNHVGFILKDDEDTWFIHSSYYEPNHVVKERARYSSILAGSNVFVLGHLGTNPQLLGAWLKGSLILVED